MKSYFRPLFYTTLTRFTNIFNLIIHDRSIVRLCIPCYMEEDGKCQTNAEKNIVK